MTQPADAVTEVAGQALHVRALASADRDALVALHRTVFQSDVDAPWHEWKYGAGRGHGSGAWVDGVLVAHCGGIARTLWLAGQPTASLQIGDVMVEPCWRGVLTRRGPFFHASQHFYDTWIGTQEPFQLGFGFPGERHLRLAKMVGLLRDGGGVHALHWSTDSVVKLPPWSWRWSALDCNSPEFDATINQAWQTMRSLTPLLAIGQRDAEYVRWRFVERPSRQHHFFALHRPWSHQPVGVAVLDLQGQHAAHWLDWIGPPDLLGLVSRACRHEAARHGRHRLEMWATAAVFQHLSNSGLTHQAEVVRLGIVNTSALNEAATTGLSWWLMGGDTDFL